MPSQEKLPDEKWELIRRKNAEIQAISYQRKHEFEGIKDSRTEAQRWADIYTGKLVEALEESRKVDEPVDIAKWIEVTEKSHGKNSDRLKGLRNAIMRMKQWKQFILEERFHPPECLEINKSQKMLAGKLKRQYIAEFNRLRADPPGTSQRDLTRMKLLICAHRVTEMLFDQGYANKEEVAAMLIRKSQVSFGVKAKTANIKMSNIERTIRDLTEYFKSDEPGDVPFMKSH